MNKYLVTAKDGSQFIATKDKNGWIATRMNGKNQYFAQGYIIESQELS